MLDLLLTARVDIGETMNDLSRELTPGLRILELREGPLKQSSLQSMLRAASYAVEVPDRRSPSEWRLAIDELLARDEIPWSHQRGKETKSYDLRPLILTVRLLRASDGVAELSMDLRNDERGAGRPEQVLLALGSTEEPTRIHRTAIELAGEPVSA